MRVDVKKYLFFGARSALENFFGDAQEQGVVEFIDPKRKKIKEVPAEINLLQQAIRVVHHLPPVEQLELEDYSTAEQVAKEVVAIHDAIEGLLEERREIRQEIARIEPFGNFDPGKIAYIKDKGQREVQFFCAKHQAELGIVEDDDIIHVASEHGLGYFVAFNKERRSYKGMLEMIIDTPLDELRGRFAEINREIQAKETELKAYADRDDFLHEALLDRVNRHELTLAKGAVLEAGEGRAFYIEGWAPKHRTKDFELKKWRWKSTTKFPPVSTTPAILVLVRTWSTFTTPHRIPTAIHHRGFWSPFRCSSR